MYMYVPTQRERGIVSEWTWQCVFMSFMNESTCKSLPTFSLILLWPVIIGSFVFYVCLIQPISTRVVINRLSCPTVWCRLCLTAGRSICTCSSLSPPSLCVAASCPVCFIWCLIQWNKCVHVLHVCVYRHTCTCTYLIQHLGCTCTCVCMCMNVWVVCVCVWERERECVCVWVWVCMWVSACVSGVYTCVCVSVCSYTIHVYTCTYYT